MWLMSIILVRTGSENAQPLMNDLLRRLVYRAILGEQLELRNGSSDRAVECQ